MIPKRMKDFLFGALPGQALVNRRNQVGSVVFMEFEKRDTELLKALGIETDEIGPMKVICMWDEEHALEIGGYLVVDNIDMGAPSLGGIRFLEAPGKHRTATDPCAVFNLARGMTLKNAAADLNYGGGKAGIVKPGKLDEDGKRIVVERFGMMIQRYADLYNPGPDVGINDQDMKTIAIVNGLDNVVSKPSEMGGNQIDMEGGAARGVVVAAEKLLEKYYLLTKLPQFKGVEAPRGEELTVMIQGFGAVGAHTANFLVSGKSSEDTPKIVGVSDKYSFVYSRDGLPAKQLFEEWFEKIRNNEKAPLVVTPFIMDFVKKASNDEEASIFFSNNPNNLLRESAFCFVPATPVRNYLDVEASSGALMTTDKMGNWRMIVEGANTYAPDDESKKIRKRMEREVYLNKGIMIAPDFLVNSGGVILATYEKVIPTPEELLIPDEIFGDRAAVDRWLADHEKQFAALAEKRLKAAVEHLENIIKKNITELVDVLVSDPNLLPCDAAELIAVNRINEKKRRRIAKDI
ncbi:MAG: Glu/Leu/Phe/Val dehydrogenase dimerization domain-containing protein, partial [Planctomycetota bacterium]